MNRTLFKISVSILIIIFLTITLPGSVPNPVDMPNYCYFKDRCEMCVEGCDGAYPCQISLSDTHKVSCYRYYDKKEEE